MKKRSGLMVEWASRQFKGIRACICILNWHLVNTTFFIGWRTARSRVVMVVNWVCYSVHVMFSVQFRSEVFDSDKFNIAYPK